MKNKEIRVLLSLRKNVKIVFK